MHERAPSTDSATVLAADTPFLPWHEKLMIPQITLRATLVGLFIGSIVLVSNFQFGLQTGWVSMMSLPSALLGFAMFKFSPYADSFSDV
ncbi:hypothetical protein OXX69_006837, partial [Metschnikowia pulcherrima]